METLHTPTHKKHFHFSIRFIRRLPQRTRLQLKTMVETETLLKFMFNIKPMK